MATATLQIIILNTKPVTQLSKKASELHLSQHRILPFHCLLITI